jgi:hypothetical protein
MKRFSLCNCNNAARIRRGNGSQQRVIVDRYTCFDARQHQFEGRKDAREHTSSSIRRLINPNQPVTELKHVVPQGYDDELCVFSPIFDVVRDDGDVPEVESRVDLVHEVQWGGLITHVSTEVAKRR